MKDQNGTASNQLPEFERKAMLGDRMSVLKVISALRTYREVVDELLSKRYQDGECDAAALSKLEHDVAELRDLNEEQDIQ